MLQVSREAADSSYAKRTSFDPDSMLQVAEKDSSYARREMFEPDSMLAVAEAAGDSSYGKEKRADFEADAMLQIGRKDVNSYAE